MVDGRLNFDTHISTNGFSKGLNTLGGQMKALQGTAAKLAGVLAGVFSVKQVIEYAAQVKALDSQFRQTFGSLREQAQKAVSKVADSAGILDSRLKSTASSIYAFAKANGMDERTALTMMSDALEVTADSAAYYDRSLEETGETLKSFLKGNYANDAALGIACTETTRNAAANRLYGKTFMELSEAQKQLTLLQMVKDANAASGALGQAAREADGWENVLGNLKEAWKQLLAVIGQPILAAIIPIIKSITSALMNLTETARAAANAIAHVFGLELESAESMSGISQSSDDTSQYWSDAADNAEDFADAVDDAADSFDDLTDKASVSDVMDANTVSADGLADSAGEAADSYGAMADSAEKAEKANKGSLASFDKLNKLGEKTEVPSLDTSAAPKAGNTARQNTADTKKADDAADKAKKTSDAADKLSKAADKTTSAAVKMIDKLSEETPLEKKLTGIISRVKKLLEKLFEPLKRSWKTHGQSVINSAKSSLKSVWELIRSIGKSFAQVWTNGTGEEMLGHIFGIIKNINTFAGGLADSFRKAWEENGVGTDIVQHAADIINVILGYVENIGAAWSEWAGKVDFAPLLTAFDKLEKAVKPVLNDLGKWLTDINNDLLIPLASWTAETLIPAVLSGIADALDGLRAAWETAYPVLKEKLWDGFLLPLAKWAAEKTIELIGELGDGIKKLGESMTEEDVQVLIHLAETIAAITLACKGAALVNGLGTAIAKLAGTIGPAFAGIGTAAGVSISGAILPAVAAALVGWGIGTMIYDKFGEEIDSVLHPIFDKIVGACDVIAGGFSELVENTIPNIIEAIVSPFAAIGDKISELSGAVGEKMNSLADSIIMIWDSFGETITETIPGFFLETIPNAFSGMWENIKTGTDEFLVSLGEVLVGAWNKITGFFKSSGEAADSFLHPIFDGITSFFTEKIPNFFGELPGRITGALGSLADTLGEIFSGAWSRIKSVFSPETASKHFSGIGEKIKTVFSKLGTSIKDAFKTAWSAVTSVFDLSNVRTLFSNVAVKAAEGFSRIISLIKEPVNGVIDVINFLIRAIASGFNAVTGTVEKLVNSVADVVNKLSFDIPDWAGGGTLGFNMPHISISDISIPTLPRLATGTVVPANYGEFTAILGDNKREPEIVSPLSEMRKAVIQAMREMGFDGKQDANDINIYIDGYELSYYVEQRGNTRKKRTGGV